MMQISGLPITGLYAAALALLVVGLTARVVLLRRSLRVGIGDGGHGVLAKAVRVHGNAVENIPFCLLLMALVEAGGASALSLHVAGGVLLVARILHVLGLSKSVGSSFGRVWGMLGTWAVMLLLSVLLLQQFWSTL